MNKIRVSAFVLAAFSASFAAGCAGEDDAAMVKNVRACVSVYKNKVAVKDLVGTVDVTYYTIDGDAKSGQTNTGYGNPYYDPATQQNSGSDGHVSFGVETGMRCPVVSLNKSFVYGKVKVDTVMISGSSFTVKDGSQYGSSDTADGLKGKVIPVDYDKDSQTAEVKIVFDFDDQTPDDSGKFVAKLQRLMNRKPGFSPASVADRHSNPRSEGAVASEASGKVSANAAI